MPTKCSYPDCLGIFPDTLLETCRKENCNYRLHHLCQTEYESKKNVDIGLHKYCINCCNEAIREKYPYGLVGNEEEKSDNENNDDDDSGGTIDLIATIVDEIAEETVTATEMEVEIEETPRTGKNLPEIVIPVNEKDIKPTLKCQKGLKGNSVVLCPSVFLHNNETLLESIRKEFKEVYGPYAYGKITQVPNRKKNVNEYMIEYDNEKGLVDDVAYEDLCTLIPGSSSMKNLLKRAVERANVIDYRFPKKKKRKRKIGATGTAGAEESVQNSSVFLGAILNENADRRDDGINNMELENDEASLSDDGSDCNLNESAFQKDDDVDEDGRSPIVDLVDNEDEIDYMGTEWAWNSWRDIDADEEIQGPPENDRYNGPHGLRKGIGNRFDTVLQCVMTTTAMSLEFFERLAAQSNKYARNNMKVRNSTLFIGHKWENIRAGEMIRFFGIMLRISLEPRKMGGYCTYFADNTTLHLDSNYSVQLRGYNAWAKEIMPLIRFKQIRSAFHPETGESECGDKCHQLRYFIRMYNYMAKEVFHLGPNVSFDEGGVAMRSRYCPVRQYNKDKPEKFRVDFFIMADAAYHFIYHLDVYQGKNKANIDIDSTLRKLPTTQKAVANAIVKTKIANDKDGSRHIYMDNRYASPQLLALMLTNYNVRGVGTCKANRIGFDSDSIQISKSCDRGTFARKVDPRLGMVITRWKDSKILQTVSTVMKSGVSEVSRRTGATVVKVRCPNDIILYQQYMDGVDRGDQHRVVGAGFANVAHFKKWYKKAFLGICDFSFLQAFTAWNLSVGAEERRTRGRGTDRRNLLKWEFYSVAAEEMMTFADNEDIAIEDRRIFSESHVPIPIPREKNKRESGMKVPTCMICSMEEGVQRNVFDDHRKKARKYSRRTSHLSVCKDKNCNIICHTCCPEEAKISSLPQFRGMSCFEIAHHEECRNLFVEVNRDGKKYTRSVRKHPIATQLTKFYENLYGIGEKEQVTARRGRPKSTEDSANARGNPTANPPVDKICLNPDENISLLGSRGSPSTTTVQRPRNRRIPTRSRVEVTKRRQPMRTRSSRRKK